MSASKPTSPAGPSLADDFHQAAGMLASIRGKSARPAPLALLLLAAIWLAVERLRQVVQASAQAGDWTASEAATIAKGRELKIEARPGEAMSDYRARITAGLKMRGQA